MEFNVSNPSDRKEIEKLAIISFLDHVDSYAISNEVANTMSWGDGDPIVLAIEILKKKVEEW